MWCGEALGWGFRVLKFRFFLVLFFCEGWLQRFSKIFDLWSSRCLLLHSSCHLGSLLLAAFILPSVAAVSHLSLRFYSLTAYTVCFCALVSILDLSCCIFKRKEWL
jgi:hypothetical protein